MEERNVTVDRETGGSLATFSLVAVIVVVALIGLFVWQPWNQTARANQTSTSIGAPGGSQGTSQTNGSSTTTTTTTNGGGTH